MSRNGKNGAIPKEGQLCEKFEEALRGNFQKVAQKVVISEDNVQKSEKKKQNKRNKKKLDKRNTNDVKECVTELEVSRQPLIYLDQIEQYFCDVNYVRTLTERLRRYPNALFQCVICMYHCDSMDVVRHHVKDKRHQRSLRNESERYTLQNLPPPTHTHLRRVDELLEDQVQKYGLSHEDLVIRQHIAETLDNCLRETIPEVTVRMYGSSCTGYGLKCSNLNMELCIPPEMNGAEVLQETYYFIRDNEQYIDVLSDFNTRIPNVKFTDSSTNVMCVLNLSDNHSYKTSQLLSKYSAISETGRKLVIAFRIWAQLCELDCIKSGMLPAYAFPLLAIYFLQQLHVPVLPVLHELVSTPGTEKNDAEIYLDPKDLEGKWKSRNTMTLGELWLEILRFYAVDFDITGRIVCIQQLKPLLRKDLPTKWAGKKIAIQDPFLPKRNVSRGMVNPASFEYFLNCFQKTYKYFGIIQSEKGPIFDIILRDIEALKHPILQEKLSKLNLLRDHTNSVTIRNAYEMASYSDNSSVQYKFDVEICTGSKKCPLVCNTCQKEGHTKDSCREENLSDFDTELPPLVASDKEALDALCVQVMDLYAITDEELLIRDNVLTEIENFILPDFPTAKMELFGSSCNGFGLSKSDIDICLTFVDNETAKDLDFVKLIEKLQTVLEKLASLERLLAIKAAKVPILKFFHSGYKLEGDISLYNTLGKENTRLLHTYAEIDERVKMLGYMIKRFAKVCDICDASKGSLSSYAYILMVIHFLQQCTPPVLPVLQKLSNTQSISEKLVEGWNTYFFDDLDRLEEVWSHYGENKSSVGELWIQLLKFYSTESVYRSYVITIRQEEPFTHFEKLWTDMPLAIEDPFNLKHNLGSGVSRKMLNFIIQCFRNAYIHFGTPFPEMNSTQELLAHLFKPEFLTNGDPPNDRGCRICKKIGHISKECPDKRKSKQRKSGKNQNMPVGKAAALLRAQEITAQKNKHLHEPISQKTSMQNPVWNIQSNKGQFSRFSGDIPAYRGNSFASQNAFKAQGNTGVRYGLPQADPPFRFKAPTAEFRKSSSPTVEFRKSSYSLGLPSFSTKVPRKQGSGFQEGPASNKEANDTSHTNASS